MADARSHMEKLSKDPDFDSSFSQIADFTQVTRIELSPDDVRTLAQRSLFFPDSGALSSCPTSSLMALPGCSRSCGSWLEKRA